MRYRVLALLAGVLGVSLAVGAAPAHAGYAPRPPVRVMVVGDSISQGIGGDWTWRNWLWREVRRQGVAVDFVGPRHSVTTGYGTRYEQTWGWDSDHAALAGATTDYFQARLEGLLADYPTDVMLLQLGLNDLLHGDSAATVTRQLQQLLRTAWAARPGLRVVLAEITSTGKTALDAAGASVNSALAAWARGKPLTIAHNRTGEGSGSLAWSPARLSFDNVHPNATGQTLYAHRFAQALHRIGVLPQPIGTVYRQRTWAPGLRPAVTTARAAIRVGWRTTTGEVAVNYVRVLVDGAPATSWVKTPTRSDTQTVGIALRPGWHRVQLAPRRGRMVGAPGPVVTVQVPA